MPTSGRSSSSWVMPRALNRLLWGACCIPFVQFPLAVVSIVLVVLSKKGQPLSGFAIAGLVLAIISIIISILMTLYWGFLISMMNDPEFMSIYNEMLEMYE